MRARSYEAEGDSPESYFQPVLRETVSIQGHTWRSALWSVLIDGAGGEISTNTVGTGAGGKNQHPGPTSRRPERRDALGGDDRYSISSATGGTITVDATNTVTMNSASITASSTGDGGCRQHQYHRDQRLHDAEQYYHDTGWTGGRRRQHQSDDLSCSDGIAPKTA